MKSNIVKFIPLLLLLMISCNTRDGASALSEEEQERYYHIVRTAIPEIEMKAREVERISRKRVNLRVFIDFENPENGFYPVQVYEDHKDRAVTLWRFRVHSVNHTIEFHDIVEDRYISLSEWRASRAN